MYFRGTFCICLATYLLALTSIKVSFNVYEYWLCVLSGHVCSGKLRGTCHIYVVCSFHARSGCESVNTISLWISSNNVHIDIHYLYGQIPYDFSIYAFVRSSYRKLDIYEAHFLHEPTQCASSIMMQNFLRFFYHKYRNSHLYWFSLY